MLSEDEAKPGLSVVTNSMVIASSTLYDNTEAEKSRGPPDTDASIIQSSVASPVSTSLKQWRSLVANNEHLIPSHKKNTRTKHVATERRNTLARTADILSNNVLCGIEVSASKTMSSTECITLTDDDQDPNLDKSSSWKMATLKSMQRLRQQRMPEVAASPSIIDWDENGSKSESDGDANEIDDSATSTDNSNTNTRSCVTTPPMQDTMNAGQEQRFSFNRCLNIETKTGGEGDNHNFFSGAGCMKDMTTIPMATSDIYSDREEQEQGSSWTVNSETCSCSYSSTSISSIAIGPIPRLSSSEDNSNEPISIEEGTHAFSVDNETMILPSQLPLISTFADEILNVASSDESTDSGLLVGNLSISDSFEQHVAGKFITTFGGAKGIMLEAGNSTSCAPSNDKSANFNALQSRDSTIYKINSESCDTGNFADTKTGTSPSASAPMVTPTSETLYLVQDATSIADNEQLHEQVHEQLHEQQVEVVLLIETSEKEAFHEEDILLNGQPERLGETSKSLNYQALLDFRRRKAKEAKRCRLKFLKTRVKQRVPEQADSDASNIEESSVKPYYNKLDHADEKPAVEEIEKVSNASCIERKRALQNNYNFETNHAELECHFTSLMNKPSADTSGGSSPLPRASDFSSNKRRIDNTCWSMSEADYFILTQSKRKDDNRPTQSKQTDTFPISIPSSCSSSESSYSIASTPISISTCTPVVVLRESKRNARESYQIKRSSQEISCSVNQILDSVLSDNFDDRDKLVDNDTVVHLSRHTASTQSSHNFHDELISNASRVHLPLSDFSTSQENDSSDGFATASILDVPATLRAAARGKTAEDISKSVDKVLGSLMKSPTSDGSVYDNLSISSSNCTTVSETGDAFFTDTSNNFFDLFDVSTSVSGSVLFNGLIQRSESKSTIDDATDDCDATLNSIDLDIDLEEYETSTFTATSCMVSMENDDDDFEIDNPDVFFAEKIPPESSSPPTSTAIVPFLPGLQDILAMQFPLYPVVRNSPTTHLCPPSIFAIGPIKLQGPLFSNIMTFFPDTDPSRQHANSLKPLLPSPMHRSNDESQTLLYSPINHRYNNKQEERKEDQSSLSIAWVADPTDTGIDTCVSPASVCKRNPKWSFLDLERSIDESLDNFMNDLLSPIGNNDNDSSLVSDEAEAALQELLSSDYCDGTTDSIIHGTKQQTEAENALRLDLNLSLSTFGDEVSSVTSPCSSCVGHLKMAALLSDGGESELANESSGDDQSESVMPGKQSCNLLAGMEFGATSMIGGDSSKLDDSNVELPELFTKKHFGSISEMVQDVHLMKAIEIEQARFARELSELKSISSASENPEQFQLEFQQKGDFDFLKQQMEEEIEAIHLVMDRMRSAVKKDDIFQEGSDEALLGWRDKFENLKADNTGTPTSTEDLSADEGNVLSYIEGLSSDCKGDSPCTKTLPADEGVGPLSTDAAYDEYTPSFDISEGIEVELLELHHMLDVDDEKRDGGNDKSNVIEGSPCIKELIAEYDGLDNELKDLCAFEDQLCQELKRADQNAITDLTKAPNVSQSKMTICNATKSIDTANDHMDIACLASKTAGEEEVVRKVSFAPTLTEYHFVSQLETATVFNFVDTDADSDDSVHEHEKPMRAPTKGAPKKTIMDRLPVTFNNMFTDLSYVFGWQKPARASAVPNGSNPNTKSE